MKKLLFLALLLAGCGDVRPDAITLETRELDAEALDAQYGNVKIECGKEACESKKEYCLKSTKDYESVSFLQEACVERPIGCNDCTCMRADAQAQFKGAKNCKGAIHCSQLDSQVVITCVVPPSAFGP